jgi:hypothetical protein
MTSQTYTVLSAYQGRDGVLRVYLRGIQGAVIAAEPFDEGAAVVIRDGVAVRPS